MNLRDVLTNFCATVVTKYLYNKLCIGMHMAMSFEFSVRIVLTAVALQLSNLSFIKLSVVTAELEY